MRSSGVYCRAAGRVGRAVTLLPVCIGIVLSSCATDPVSPPLVSELAMVPPLPPPDLMPRSLSRPDADPRPAALRLLEATRFTLTVQDAELRGLLLGLGRESPLNVVVDRRVTGLVTADLREATLLEILDQVVVQRGYRYEFSGGVLRISPSEPETRIYRLSYPNYVREGTSELALAGFIGAAPSIGEGAGDSSGGEDSSLSELTTTYRSDVWTEVEQAVRTIVFGSTEATGDSADEAGEGEDAAEVIARPPRRRVVVSRQAALVSVTAEPAALQEVERYLTAVAESMDQQVLIDAQFVEITLGDELDIGVDYEVAAENAGIFSRLITPGSREAMLAQSLAPVLTKGGLQLGVANNNFGAILRALAIQTDVRVVSTPRITTLNNHKALIKVVRNEVFFVAEVETVATDSAVLQTTEFKPQVIPVGVTLDVTPHVSNGSEITLHLRPSVSEIVGVEAQPTSDPDLPQNGSLPVVDLRETDSVVRVSDGTTIVIGGMVRSREMEEERRVPFLGNIPWLGMLFKRLITDEQRTELVVFLTPTILDRPRVQRVSDVLGAGQDVVDELRHDRTEWPWWRAPYGRSYGVKR